MPDDTTRTSGEEPKSYRCPVCGHVDATSLGGAESAVVRCSHCDTHLEVRPKTGPTLSVRVAPRSGQRSRERA